MLHECLILPILEMMNSVSVHVSSVPSLQLDISLSMDYLASYETIMNLKLCGLQVL